MLNKYFHHDFLHVPLLIQANLVKFKPKFKHNYMSRNDGRPSKRDLIHWLFLQTEIFISTRQSMTTIVQCNDQGHLSATFFYSFKPICHSC